MTCSRCRGFLYHQYCTVTRSYDLSCLNCGYRPLNIPTAEPILERPRANCLYCNRKINAGREVCWLHQRAHHIHRTMHKKGVAR